MRTDADLRTAIDTLAGEPGDTSALAEDILSRAGAARAKPGSGPGRRALVAASVVAAVAVALVGVEVAERLRPDTRAGDTARQPLEWVFSVHAVPGYQILRDSIARPTHPAAMIMQYATVLATGGSRTSGAIEVDLHPGRIVRAAQSSVVDGQRYWFRPGQHVTRQGGLTAAQYADPWKAVRQDAHGPQLSWQAADGTQVVITGSFGFDPDTYDYDNTAARSALMSLALAVRTGVREAPSAPMRVAGVPAGLVPVSLSGTAASETDTAGRIGPAAPVSVCVNYARPDRPSPLTAFLGLVRVCRASVPTTVQASLDAIALGSDFARSTVSRRLPDGTILAAGLARGDYGEPVDDGGLTTADLRRILDRTGTTPALDRPDTWSPVG